MTAPIEDVSTLPGKKLSDQMANPIGKVTDIFATDDGYPMWVGVDASPGMSRGHTVFVPLARIKDEGGELRVPYSKQHVIESPEVDADAGISAECDRRLRDFYGIDAGDQEMRTDNKSYAARVPESGGGAQRVDDPDQLETPDADTRTDESDERLRNPGSSETRDVTAEDVAHDDQRVDGAESSR
ncbi:MAG TPA: PRC-barrel domain-containing protein [Solirubrobacteraceae bacterium]|nr:PRC-barrel domain-containing protein [Solirubrobacteraceae bacterium]